MKFKFKVRYGTTTVNAQEYQRLKTWWEIKRGEGNSHLQTFWKNFTAAQLLKLAHSKP